MKMELRQMASPIPVVVTAVVGLVAVLAWGLIVKGDAAVRTWDQSLLVRINAAWSSGMDALARVINWVFSPAGALVLIVLVVVVLSLTSHRLGSALFVGFGIGVLYASTYIVKLIVGRPRPAPLSHVVTGIAMDTSPGYPSGHVAMIASLLVILCLVMRGGARWAVAVVGGLLLVVVAYARLYVGAHYLDDVLASAVYAATVGPLVYMVLYLVDAKLGAVRAVNGWAARWSPFRERQSVGAS